MGIVNIAHWNSIDRLTPHALRIIFFCAMRTILASWVGYALIGGNEDQLLPAIGCAALLVLLVPVAFQRHYDLFQPLTFVILTTFVGVTLRSIYIDG